MIKILKKNKRQTGSGWENNFVTDKSVSIKEVTIACGWNKHWLKDNEGLIKVLRGIGHLSINHQDEKTLTENDIIDIKKHSLVDFQYSQIEYLFIENAEEYEEISCTSTSSFVNHPGKRTVLYVLDGSGTMIDSDGQRKLVGKQDAIEMNDEELVKLKGEFTILKLVFNA